MVARPHPLGPEGTLAMLGSPLRDGPKPYLGCDGWWCRHLKARGGGHARRQVVCDQSNLALCGQTLV